MATGKDRSEPESGTQRQAPHAQGVYLTASDQGQATGPSHEVVISNGFGRFDLLEAATEMARRGTLAAFLSGAYPNKGLASFVKATGLDRSAAFERFLARAASLPADRVYSLWVGEPFYQLGSRTRSLGPWTKGLADLLNLQSRRLYAAAAASMIGKLGKPRNAGIYHYRAGFGGDSVGAARRLGWLCLCHHTIAHPATLEYLVGNGGSLPPEGVRGPMDRNWQAILEDIERADHVLTNSEFVKTTFVHQGWEADKVDVLYFGVADPFLARLPARQTESAGPLKALFAGSFGSRKGAPTIAEAIPHLPDDWRLDICGPVEADCAKTLRELTKDNRVTYCGNLPVSSLAAKMAAADVFVFPTLAEGSARVLWEALAAGCYVVTTPNGGSIVEDGEHGRLVPPGSVSALVDACLEASADRPRVARIGRRNAALVRRHYRQAHFGDHLTDLYARLLGN